MLSISHSFPISCLNTPLKYGSFIRPLPYIVLFSVFRLVPQILALHAAKHWRRTTISVRERTSSHKSKNKSYVYLSSENCPWWDIPNQVELDSMQTIWCFYHFDIHPKVGGSWSTQVPGGRWGPGPIYLIVRSQLELILSVLRDFDALTTARKT